MHVTEFGLQLISDATTLADETNITSTDYATNPSISPNSHTTPGKADKHNTPYQNFVQNILRMCLKTISQRKHACVLYHSNTP